MDDELTNLLPPSQLKLMRRRYFVRVFVVLLVLVICLIGAAAVLLIPTYVYLSDTAEEKRVFLAQTEAAAPSVNENDLARRLAVLTSNAKTLTALGKAQPIDVLMSTILDVPHLGITLSGFHYTPAAPEKKSLGTLTITGVAATRDALRNYQVALQDVALVGTAALPVSAYAQNSNIDFTITLTLSP